MPGISLIVPIFNAEKYIEECVESLYGQTFDDLEIVLVDDCSTDNSIALALSALEKYPNRKDQVKVVRHEKNMGIGYARRDGFYASTGCYFLYVDSDDYLDRDAVRLLYDKAVSENADVVICDYYKKWSESKLQYQSILPTGIVGNGDNVRDEIINRRVMPFLWVKLMRRELLEGDTLWPRGSMGDDTLIGVQAAYRAKKTVHLEQPLYYYRVNPESITRNLDEEKCLRNLKGFKANVDDTILFLEREGVADKYAEGILICKICTKNRILKVIHKPGYKRMWLSVYPEVNKTAFFWDRDLKLTFREHVWFWLLMLGAYPRWKKVMKRKLRPRRGLF